MINSPPNPVEEGSNSAISESYSMTDKVQKDVCYTREDIEQNINETPTKYGLSLFFRHLVCCACLTSENSTHKYKLNPSDTVDSSKGLTNDINGKKKKGDHSKETRQKIIDKSRDIGQENNSAAICSPPAQNISASNGTNPNFRDSRGNDSQESEDNSKSNKICTYNEKLLTAISDKNRNKKCFIIDLDETLVHSSFKYVKTADINVNVDIDGIQHEVFVCKRPYADEFLAELGDLFECVLFTASLGKYADPVTNFLDPNGIFSARLFREACAFREGNYVKDLDVVGRDLDSIVILDNSPVSYLLHPRNALQIVSWFDDPSDTALRDLIPYFKALAASPLTVPDWLESNRPPESAGILGHPPSNLHWILMQTLSVPEAVAVHQQRLRESYHAASGSSNVSRQSSTRGANEGHDPHSPHHGLITQAIKASRRKSMAAQEDESNRPPVSSPVARPSSGICLDDDDDDDDDIDYLMESYTEQEGVPEDGADIPETRIIYHHHRRHSSADPSPSPDV